jgi:hypothetical protein
MKSAHVTLSILLAVLVFLFTGCKAKDTASNTAARSAPAAASNTSATDNSNRSLPPPAANRNSGAARQSGADVSSKAGASPQLIGTYESREVQDKGVVTLISQLRTLLVFSSDGHYSRVSQVKGKTYHSDSGMFRIEAPDKLVLTIQMTGQKAQRKLQNPPLAKTHTFSLSSDGDELKLTSDKGAVATFRRVAKPKTS